MKINTVKQSLLGGVIYGAVTFVIYCIFTCLLYYYLKGEFFISKGGTKEFINGIPFVGINIMGAVISSLIPVFLIRYTSIFRYIICIFVAALLYAFLLVMLYVLVFSMPLTWALKHPMNSFDALYWGILIFPVGAFGGMIITIIINSIFNRKP